MSLAPIDSCDRNIIKSNNSIKILDPKTVSTKEKTNELSQVAFKIRNSGLGFLGLYAILNVFGINHKILVIAGLILLGASCMRSIIERHQDD